MKTRSYVAAKAYRPEITKELKALRDEGFAITSTWIDLPEDQPLPPHMQGMIWEAAKYQIMTSHQLVAWIRPQDLPLKGVLVEIGIAIGMGKIVRLVAPDVEFDSRTGRPLGSWIMSNHVTLHHSLKEALGMPTIPRLPDCGCARKDAQLIQRNALELADLMMKMAKKEGLCPDAVQATMAAASHMVATHIPAGSTSMDYIRNHPDRELDVGYYMFAKTPTAGTA